MNEPKTLKALLFYWKHTGKEWSVALLPAVSIEIQNVWHHTDGSNQLDWLEVEATK